MAYFTNIAVSKCEQIVCVLKGLYNTFARSRVTWPLGSCGGNEIVEANHVRYYSLQ